MLLGKFLKKGVLDVVAAARSVLYDWNSGKIKYCTQPPEVQDSEAAHISASIVHSDTKEFDIENFEQMETDILNTFDVKQEDVMEITSTGPVEYKPSTEEAPVNAAEIDESEPRGKK